jgi:toxin ParE1/3/4
MAAFAVEVHPLAADEAEAAERWYRDRNEAAASRFRRQLDRAMELIAERPEAAPAYIGNTRRFLLRRFPFFVIYRASSGHIQVVAVAQSAASSRAGPRDRDSEEATGRGRSLEFWMESCRYEACR